MLRPTDARFRIAPRGCDPNGELQGRRSSCSAKGYERFLASVVLHTGPHVYRLGEKIIAAPIAALWG
jgi:hypothetical protein